MKFTWVSFFKLVERMWDLNQNSIANYLGYHRATISKLLNGKQKSFSKSANEIYQTLFDPTNQKLSHVFMMDEKYLLNNFIQEISKMGLSKTIENIEYNDYNTFILELAGLAKESQPAKDARTKQPKNDITPKHQKVTSDNQSKPEYMLNIFKQNFSDYDIHGFFRVYPGLSFDSRYREDAKTFISSMKYNQNREDILDKDTEVYQKIICFTDLLLGYYKYLFDRMEEKHIYDAKNSNQYRVEYAPPTDDEAFKTETAHYCQSLHALYDEITGYDTK